MNYLPVRLSTLKAQTNLGFDVFVKLPHKYVRYNDNGDFLEEETISRLKAKKVKKLFIDENDEPKYQAFLDQRLSKAIDDPSASVEEKSSAAVGSCLNASDKVYEKPGDRTSYEAAKNASSSMLKVLREKEEALATILGRTDHAQADNVEKMRAHAVNSCSLSLQFGEFLGLKEEEIEALGVAALYHDIGFANYSEELKECFFMEFKEIDGSRLGEYKEHPRKAVEVLQDKPFASKEVLDLILTHEERHEGAGFPQALQKLTLAQQAHALCCHYDREITCLGKDRKAVVENFTVNEMGRFELDILKKFKNFCVKFGF